MMSQKNDEHCTWNMQTSVKEIIPFYDFQNSINSYLCKLTQGYIFIGKSGIKFTVLAYAYDGNFIADNMFRQREGRELKESDYIVHGSPFTFLTMQSGKYRFLESNDILSDEEIDRIKKRYNEFYSILARYLLRNYQVTKQLSRTDNGRQQLRTQTITDEYTIPHLLDSDYQVFTTSDFPGYQNHCAPTAGTNLMYYWGKKANRKKANLWSGSVFADLYKYMKTNNGHSGTNFEDKLPGLISYSNSRNVTVAGSDVIGAATNFNIYKKTLKDVGPFLLDLVYNDTSKNHTIFVTGYQCVLYDKDYLRVLDGWSDNRSNFFSDLYACGNITYTRY
ncbi:hypothetical protein [Caproicibacterium amylolyticum]|uniref:Uncharacterized protein n=1 Tax=Caproicibacterium amylolyticum TaxID=2766537 RepID=A0A7G9WHN5_9FIRM|nr:hypothetical protein [Caproicibacterium amylolyticum]QNO18197.1 hypothetical protein H6X83_00560 [Caproicibacterium amylolyticum]